MVRPALVLAAGVVLACALAACSSSPPTTQTRPARSTSTTALPTTTTSDVNTTTTTTTTTMPGLAVPNVIGLKGMPARFILAASGFVPLALNKPCGGTAASQSVVASLSIPGQEPDRAVGATPLAPGTDRPKGSVVAITWSGCYPDGTSVPAVVGLHFKPAVHLLHAVGLTWACFSVGADAPTTKPPPPTSSNTTTTTTKPPTPPAVVLTQSPTAGVAVAATSTVTLTMRACPQ